MGFVGKSVVRMRWFHQESKEEDDPVRWGESFCRSFGHLGTISGEGVVLDKTPVRQTEGVKQTRELPINHNTLHLHLG